MVPIPSSKQNSARLLYILFSVATQYVPNSLRTIGLFDEPVHNDSLRHLAKREDKLPQTEQIAFGVLVPVLVLLSGLFAGLTLGYMSLDETQLNVLSISGTPQQREYANKIKPIRENGHLLLVTLLLCNMIANESLPIIADPLLGGGVQSVVVSTTLIVIFAEIIPQSLFTRHGLYLGAKMAGLTRVLLWIAMPVSWPVAKILEFVLGPHHGIIYRRAELKELIAMHSSMGNHGGDLKIDTVTIIGATLDLQEKVVRQAMTPIEDVFMVSIDSKLDYDLMRQICMTGHSRVPVYEEIEIPIHSRAATASMGINAGSTDGSKGPSIAPRTQKVKKIIGILLVKQCVLLDPKDAVPLRKIPLNKVLYVPQNEPLLGILDRFQEGRSHMAIVSRFSREKAASVKKVVKHSLTQRLRQRVGIGESSDSSDEEDQEKTTRTIRRGRKKIKDVEEATEDGEMTLKDSSSETASVDNRAVPTLERKDSARRRMANFQLPRMPGGMGSISQLEQHMPADAVLGKENAEEFLQGFDLAVSPLGIITLEDVLEELIGEEIYDEFDAQGAHGDYVVPQDQENAARAPPTEPPATRPVLKPLTLKGFGFLRSRSAPPSPRDVTTPVKDAIPENLDVLATTLDRSEKSISRAHSSSDLENMKQATLSVPGQASDGDRISTNENQRTINHRGPPSIIVEQQTPTSSRGSLPDEKEMELKAPTPVTPIPRVTIIQPEGPSKMGGAGSRSTSPAPSLEALLLDRKRRAAAAVSTGSAPPSVNNLLAPGNVPAAVNLSRPANASKGARFKSSPLVGERPRSGLIIAEHVKSLVPEDEPSGGNNGGLKQEGQDDYTQERISGENKQEGPDKDD